MPQGIALRIGGVRTFVPAHALVGIEAEVEEQRQYLALIVLRRQREQAASIPGGSVYDRPLGVSAAQPFHVATDHRVAHRNIANAGAEDGKRLRDRIAARLAWLASRALLTRRGRCASRSRLLRLSRLSCLSRLLL